MQQLTDKEFVELLRRRDIQISGRNGKLQINAPTGALNDAIRAELPRRKPSLLALLDGAAKEINASEPAPLCINSFDSSVPAPLSFAQQRLWIIDRFHPGNIAYNIPEAFRIDGPFDIEKLGEAVRVLLERHQILRMYVEELEGVPYQRIAQTLNIPIGFTDLSSAAAEDSDERLRAAIHGEATRSFDLHQASLVRFHVFRIRRDSHVILINIHHLLADRWSLRILRRELGDLYSSAVNGTPSHLAPLLIQYSDYARWEQQQFQDGGFGGQVDYWVRKLGGAPARLELPFARPHPAIPSFAGAVETCILDASLTAQLRLLAKEENASLFMVLLAAFSVLLHRYSGAEDLCIGSPISGRTRVETESIVGLFVNILVLRCELQSGLTFREILHRTRNTALEAYENADVPFQKLVVDLHPDRNPGVSPLFQVFFGLDAQMPEEDGDVTQLDAHPGVAKFDLTLQLAESSDRLSGVFEYRTDLFDASSIARMARHFSTLLGSIVAAPDQAVSTLALLSKEEYDTLVRTWTQTARDFPLNQSIHGLFELQTATTPEDVAVIAGSDCITYDDLNRRANRIAHALGSRVAPEDFVGICMERSVDMIAALLGVLKSGAAYVPLDPSYPQQRMEFMAANSQMKMIVTHSSLLSKLSSYSGELLCIDRHESLLSEMPGHNLDVALKPSNAAYVIYTSGSTGQPKGVIIEHRNTVSFLHWARSVFAPEVLQGTLAATSICFDLSIFEIFLPLSFGQTVILAADILELPHLQASSQVTLVNTVPSAISALLKAGGLPASVRVVNTAGEFLPTALVNQIYSTGHVTHVYDLYGPTETTTYSTMARRRLDAFATIGRPIANTRIYLLDANLQPVPIGLPGEIYIAGAGVTRGYLRRPELTEQRFVGLTHLGETGRAYRTGDFARYLPDGSLEYAGRLDNQVKLRGHRVELGEIEATLRDYPAIADAAVILVKTSSSGEALSAFVTLRDEQQPFISEDVLSFLRQRLPAYMVVANVVALPKLPLTLNGKLDRKALAAIHSEIPSARAVRSPRDQVERQLANLWEHCFQRRPIGIDENFFEIGGHSLLAFQLFAEIEARMGKHMMLATLFKASTIEALAELMRQDGSAPPL